MASRTETLVRISFYQPYLVEFGMSTTSYLFLLTKFLCRACTCPNEDHPGPKVGKGRGAPEIDILEVEKNKTANSLGQIVSQSAQFAPFTHDYLYKNDTQDAWWIYTPELTRANDYRGSAV